MDTSSPFIWIVTRKKVARPEEASFKGGRSPGRSAACGALTSGVFPETTTTRTGSASRTGASPARASSGTGPSTWTPCRCRGRSRTGSQVGPPGPATGRGLLRSSGRVVGPSVLLPRVSELARVGVERGSLAALGPRVVGACHPGLAASGCIPGPPALRQPPRKGRHWLASPRLASRDSPCWSWAWLKGTGA